MVKSSEKFRLAAILAVVAVVVSFGTSRVLLFNNMPGMPFEKGHGFYGLGMHRISPWAGNWLTVPEAEREALFENGIRIQQAFSQHLQTIQEQHPAALVFFVIGVLGIIVLGILAFMWIDRQVKKVNAICEGDNQKTASALKVLLLSIVTFGIYGLLWLYMLGERLQENAPRHNLSFKENGTTVLLWFTLGTFILVGPIIALYIIIKNTNAMTAIYSKGAELQT